VICWSVTIVSPAKTAEPIEMPFGLKTRGPRAPCIRWGFRHPIRKAILGKEEPIISMGTFCRELCKNGQTDRFVVWIVGWGGLKEAQVQSYSPGGHMEKHIGAAWRV